MFYGHFLTCCKLWAELVTHAIISRIKNQWEPDGRTASTTAHYATMYHRADMIKIWRNSYKKQALRRTLWLITWEVLLVAYLNDGRLLLCAMYLRPGPLAVYLRTVMFHTSRIIRIVTVLSGHTSGYDNRNKGWICMLGFAPITLLLSTSVRKGCTYIYVNIQCMGAGISQSA
jgi:hypothetical protein